MTKVCRHCTPDVAYRRMARWAASQVPVTFVAFDLLHFDGHDLTWLSLEERKRRLDDLHLVGPAWAVNGWHPGEGDMLFEVCAELGHEGVVAKRLDAPTCLVSGHEPGSRKNALPGTETTPLGDGHG
jgi:hypothetical protein